MIHLGMLDHFTPVKKIGDLTLHRADLPMPIPEHLGRWLVTQGMFSKGNDFTNAWAKDPDYQGNSLLKKLWMGYDGHTEAGSTGMTLWLIEHQGQARGVVAWLRTDTPEGNALRWMDEVPPQSNHKPKRSIPTAHLGYVMCYLDPGLRGRGLIKRIMSLHVSPELIVQGALAQSQGRMPIVAASDATAAILKPKTPIPVVAHFDHCQALRSEVWSIWTWDRMNPETPSKRTPFLVAPTDIPGVKKRLRR